MATENHTVTRWLLMAIVALILIAIGAVVLVVTLVEDSGTAVQTIVGLVVPILGMLALYMKSDETQRYAIAAADRATEATERAAEAARKASEVSRDLKLVAEQTDGKMAELTETTRAAAEAIGHAAGMLLGRAQEKAAAQVLAATLVEGREAGKAQEQELQAARLEVPPRAELLSDDGSLP